MPIITSGIMLTNGMFVPNCGGHAKTADRICEKYFQLNRLKNESLLNSDEFLITAGCGIIAAYRGERCYKLASDNPEEVIRSYADRCSTAGFEIMPYWTIDLEAFQVLSNIVCNMKKMEIIVRSDRND